MDRFEKCKSCKHYLEYYVIRSIKFQPIGGHCSNNKLYNPRKRRNFELIENCEHWQINTEVIENRKEKIKDALFYIEEHLAHIEQILLLNKNKNAPE